MIFSTDLILSSCKCTVHFKGVAAKTFLLSPKPRQDLKLDADPGYRSRLAYGTTELYSRKGRASVHHLLQALWIGHKPQKWEPSSLTNFSQHFSFSLILSFPRQTCWLSSASRTHLQLPFQRKKEGNVLSDFKSAIPVSPKPKTTSWWNHSQRWLKFTLGCAPMEVPFCWKPFVAQKQVAEYFA